MNNSEVQRDVFGVFWVFWVFWGWGTPGPQISVYSAYPLLFSVFQVVKRYDTGRLGNRPYSDSRALVASECDPPDSLIPSFLWGWGTPGPQALRPLFPSTWRPEFATPPGFGELPVPKALFPLLILCFSLCFMSLRVTIQTSYLANCGKVQPASNVSNRTRTWSWRNDWHHFASIYETGCKGRVCMITPRDETVSP